MESQQIVSPSAATVRKFRSGRRKSLPPISIRPRWRFIRISSFFAFAVLHVYVFDIFLNRFWFTSWAVRASQLTRWRRIARRFRLLAIDLGGVQIKLGQFLSSRVDILPEVVTTELSGLQDEVPPVELPYILERLTQELGPIDEVFCEFSPEPVAAASLGQVHFGVLRDGRPVAVKVQRPRIREIVQVDLAALGWIISIVKRYPPIRRRADLQALYEEFCRVLNRELDYTIEAQNGMIFRHNFANAPGVYVPLPYPEVSTDRVLVMERINGIKITETEKLKAAGVDMMDLADRLNKTYLQQIFLDGFFHADPHPGNLFVEVHTSPDPPNANGGQPSSAGLPTEPLAAPIGYANGAVSTQSQNGNSDGGGASHAATVGYEHTLRGRPFTLIFIDFGMIGELPKSATDALRENIIGVATNDPERIVNSWYRLNMILPGADRRALVKGVGVLMNFVYNRSVHELNNVDVNAIYQEIEDLVREMPFQLPQELIFLGRAVSIVSGLITSIEPNFNLFESAKPIASRLMEREARAGNGWADQLQREALDLAKLLLGLPRQMDAYYRAAANGELMTRTDFSRLEHGVRRIERATTRLTGGVVAAGLFLSAAELQKNGQDASGRWAWRAAAAAAIWALWPRRE